MIGSTLAHYEITAKLGAGGMGEVYRARDTKLRREVAITVLPQEFATDPNRLARFEREARTLASLDHPGIAAIHDLQEAEGRHFLVMQLVDGPTLAERLRGGPLFTDTTFERAISYFEEARRIQPDFALAHARLSRALVSQFVWGFATRDEVYEAAAAAEQAAIDIDPGLALAWTARADRIESLDWDWKRAEIYHKRALEADPEDANVVHSYGLGLAYNTDRYEEAIQLGRRAAELEPTDPGHRVDLAEIMICAGRFDEAAEVLERVHETDPEYFTLYLLRGYLRILTGQYEAAIQDSRKVLEISGERRHLEYLATALALAGRTEDARAALQEFEELSKSEFIQEAELGMVHLALGNRDKAYELFERSYQQRENKLVFLRGTRFFASVEVEARLQELLDRVKVFD